MAKLSRRLLSRGVKLLTEHVWDPLTAIQTDLADATRLVGREQLVKQNGFFRVNLSVPVIDDALFPLVPGVSGDVPLEFCVPFVLPPFQEDITDGDGAMPILREISIGFDTRGEPAGICSGTTVSWDAGKIDWPGVENYDIDMSLLSKPRLTETDTPQREVWSGSISSLSLSSYGIRQNPRAWPELAAPVSPDDTLVFTLTAPGFTGNQNAIVSLVVSMKFEVPLVARDTGSTLQNFPVNYSKTATTFAPSPPNSNDPIESDTANGLQTALKMVDTLLLQKLRSGLFRDGTPHPAEQVLEDACYDVMMIPMWANFDKTNMITSANAGTLPMGGAAGSINVARSVIPITVPMAVHHVFAVVSFMNPVVGIHPPNSAAYLNAVGVAVGSGLRGDNFAYSQIAFLEWSALSKAGFIIDRVRSRLGGVLSADPVERWDFELLQIPLVERVAAGVGLLQPQGPPFWLGRTTSRGQSRSSIGAPALPSDTAPPTDGAENFIEVRWSFTDTNVGIAAFPANTTIVGYGGHWVGIVSKKALTPAGGL